MAGLDLSDSQQAIWDYASATIPFDIREGQYGDSDTVAMKQALINGYVIVRFSDGLLPSSTDNSFGGPVYDGYYGLIQFQCAGQFANEARNIANKVNKVMIGFQGDSNVGPLTKAFGGGAYTIPATNSQPQFFVAITSFRYSSNLVVGV